MGLAQGNFEPALSVVLKHEGGWVNHPRDPGGETNLGVTRRTWELWQGRPARPGEMRSLTPAMVDPLYRQRYWDRVRGDDLPAGGDLSTFDAGVNSGPGRAAKWLQAAVGTKQDGIVGPQTITAARAHPNKPGMVRKACDLRMDFLMKLSTWDTFGRGWAKRVANIKATGMAWAGAAARDLHDEANAEAAKAKRDNAGSAGAAAAAGGSGVGATGTAMHDEWGALLALTCLGIVLALVAFRLYRRGRVRRDAAREIARVARELEHDAGAV